MDHMDVYRLMAEYANHNPCGHYFDRETLRFFGERISEMRVLKHTVTVTDSSGRQHTAYCLSSLQRNNPGGPKRHYAWFDATTYENLIV